MVENIVSLVVIQFGNHQKRFHKNNSSFILQLGLWINLKISDKKQLFELVNDRQVFTNGLRLCAQL